MDLSKEYGDNKFKRVKVRGLIRTFSHYKFTIAENTPIEEEIALDPELSGRVFENLLAAYNPETGATARKQTGSFYTPRAIVNYMVDEALIACLKGKLTTDCTDNKDKKDLSFRACEESRTSGPASAPTASSAVEQNLRHLFAYNDEPHRFTPAEVDALIVAIDSLRSLDPAVGSGAFPMGILHKLVFILGKLDPQNEKWRERQRQRALRETAEVFKIGDKEERQHRLDDINEVFEQNASDYGRKLYLIENCIYGVDIQPIAVQIAKMRFFISLVADQKVDDALPNRAVRPLPNLETKFVAANTLIGITRPGQQLLRNREIDAKEAELRRVRERHFLARSLPAKRKCRDDDARLRAEIADLLKTDGWDTGTARSLADWNPYDQNASAEFFDPEWMFGVCDGFDIVLGNPPYGAELREEHKEILKRRYEHIVQRIRNSFLYFLGAGHDLAKEHGVVSYILPNEFLFQIYMTKARSYFVTNTQVLFAINVGEDVFDAIVPTCLFAFKKARLKSHEIPVSDLRVCTLDELPARLDVQTFRRLGSDTVLKTPNAMFSFDAERTNLITRLSGQFPHFEEFCDDVANGICTSCDGVYIVGEPFAKAENLEQEYMKPCIRGGQMNRFYCPPTTHELVLYITDDFEPARARNIHNYLSLHKKLLVQKSVEKKQGIRDWHVLFRARYPGLFVKPKIMIRQTADCIIAAPDTTVGYHCINSVNVALLKQEHRGRIQFFLGLLNSSLLNFYYRQVSQEAGRVLAEVKPRRIRALPIADTSERQRTAIIGRVDRILAAKRADAGADTSGLEREIDQQVYALYGLTPEEIEIVEATG